MDSKTLKKLARKSKSTLKRTLGEKIIFAIVWVLFIIYALSLIFPMYWLVINSLEDGIIYAMNSVTPTKAFAFPKKLIFKNYADAFTMLEVKDTNLWGMIFNSIWLSSVGAAISLFFHACTGYIFAKYTFKSKGFIYFVAIFCMTVPIVGSTAATYKLYLALNLYDNPIAKVVGSVGGFGGNFLILLATFKGISWSYAEAVFIDGGSDVTVFFRIMLPQAMPVLITLFIQAVIVNWKDYTNALMFYPSYPTLSTGLYQLSLIVRVQGFTVYLAGLVVSTIPVIVLYAVFSDSMMKNLSVGGLKG